MALHTIDSPTQIDAGRQAHLVQCIQGEVTLKVNDKKVGTLTPKDEAKVVNEAVVIVPTDKAVVNITDKVASVVEPGVPRPANAVSEGESIGGVSSLSDQFKKKAAPKKAAAKKK